jgi:Zn-dependent protease
VHRIILLPVGGMALLERLPREPRDELLIVAAGPLVNFVIAGLSLIFLLGWPSDWDDFSILPTNAHDVLMALLIINLSLGTFNLLPAFPMDGGRIVRALLAYFTDYVNATWWALMVGRAVALVALIFALWFQAYTLVILFTFIIILGGLEYRHVVRTEAESKFYSWMQEP